MDKVFKLVWNKTTDCLVMASELTKSKNKSITIGYQTEPSQLLAIGVAGMLLLGSGSAVANGVENGDISAVTPSTAVTTNNTTPENLTNIKGNLTPTYNKGDFEIDTITGAPKTDGATVSTPTTSMTSTTSPKAPTAAEVKAMYNNAATVGDVLNTGWNLQENDKEKDFVKPYDTLNFVNGEGTTVKVSTDENGKISKIQVDVNVDKETTEITYKTKDGRTVYKHTTKDGDAYYTSQYGWGQKVDSKDVISQITAKGGGSGEIKQAVNATEVQVGIKSSGKTIGVTPSPNNQFDIDVKTGTSKVESGKATANINNGKIATIDNVVNTINDVYHTVAAGKVEDTNGENTYTSVTNATTDGEKATDSQIKAGETVNYHAGQNIKIGGKGSTIEISTVDKAKFKQITINEKVTITASEVENSDGSKTNELNVGTTDAPTRITNVAPGVKDTDAVNVSQLKNNQNNVYQKFSDLSDKLDRVDKDLRAGIAGSTAVAFLQRPNEAGKSLVSVGMAGYRGQHAIAVGYAKNSDNNKVSIKLGLGVNTRNDMTYGGSIGYQW